MAELGFRVHCSFSSRKSRSVLCVCVCVFVTLMHWLFQENDHFLLGILYSVFLSQGRRHEIEICTMALQALSSGLGSVKKAAWGKLSHLWCYCGSVAVVRFSFFLDSIFAIF